MKYSITELATLAGVSTKTLRYYDTIGLLSAKRDSKNAYRYYIDDDIGALYTILLLKEVGYTLPEIKQRLNTPASSWTDLLKEADEQLKEQQDYIHSLRQSITSYIRMNHTIQTNSSAHQEAGQNKKIADQYAKEAYTRWGDTEAYRQSIERTAKYTKEDWNRVKEEGESIFKAIAEQMDLVPESQEVQDVIHTYYQYLQQFYDVSPGHFQVLADMYVADPRFTKTYEDIAPGLAAYMCEAMHVYATKLSATE